MKTRILIDTGPLVALFSPVDKEFARCDAVLDALTPPLLTCWPVVTEAAWLVRKRPGAFQKICEGFAGGLFAILPLDSDDLFAIKAIMTRYESARIQLADAALVHLADREQIQTLFTLDRRDFSILRLSRNRSLRLIPDLS